MTNEEALVWCDDLCYSMVMTDPVKENYIRALRALRTAMAALDKQIPQKVDGMACPNCERPFFLKFGEKRGEDYCGRCGQALKWEVE